MTTAATRATAQVIAESAGYAKRNVQEALTALHSAGVIDAVTVGNEQRFIIPRDGWTALLGLTVHDLPTHQAWPQLLHALRALVRWLEDDRHDKLSEYMLASEARTIADEVTPELHYAGVRLDRGSQPGAGYWQDFVEMVRAAVRVAA